MQFVEMPCAEDSLHGGQSWASEDYSIALEYIAQATEPCLDHLVRDDGTHFDPFWERGPSQYGVRACDVSEFQRPNYSELYQRDVYDLAKVVGLPDSTSTSPPDFGADKPEDPFLDREGSYAYYPVYEDVHPTPTTTIIDGETEWQTVWNTYIAEDSDYPLSLGPLSPTNTLATSTPSPASSVDDNSGATDVWPSERIDCYPLPGGEGAVEDSAHVSLPTLGMGLLEIGQSVSPSSLAGEDLQRAPGEPSRTAVSRKSASSRHTAKAVSSTSLRARLPDTHSRPRNIQCRYTLNTSVPFTFIDGIYRCPIPTCTYTQLKKRRADMRRHLESHRSTENQKRWVCCGVRVEDAAAWGISAQDVRRRAYVWRGMKMVGGCQKGFSRRDSLVRHLQRGSDGCKGHADMVGKFLQLRGRAAQAVVEGDETDEVDELNDTDGSEVDELDDGW